MTKEISLILFFINLTVINLNDPSLTSEYISCELKVLKVNYESDDKISKGVLLFDTDTKLTLNTNEHIRILYFDWISDKSRKIDTDNLTFIKQHCHPEGGKYLLIVDSPHTKSKVKWSLPLLSIKKIKNYYRKVGLGDVYFLEIEIALNDKTVKQLYIRFIVDEKNINCDKDLLKNRISSVINNS